MADPAKTLLVRRPRLRRPTALVLAALLIGAVGLWLWSRASAWPTRAVLRSPVDTWPLAFSADGRTFATSGGDGISLWDVENGAKRVTWPRRGSHAGVGAFSADGSLFSAAGSLHPRAIRIDVLDVATGRVAATIDSDHMMILDLEFVEEGPRLRAVLGDITALVQVVKTWDVTTGEEISCRSITCPTAACDVAISADGRLLASRPFNTTWARIWDLDSDREIARVGSMGTIPGTKLARGLAFSEDGGTVALEQADGSIEMWDVGGRGLLASFPGHSAGYMSYGLRLAPDGRTLASGGIRLGGRGVGGMWAAAARSVRGQRYEPPSEVIVVDLQTGKRLARVASSIHPMYSPDGRTIAMRGKDLAVRLRDVPLPSTSGSKPTVDRP